MKRPGPDRHLESSRFFSYIAWTLIIGFALFVYHLTVSLRTAADNLIIQSDLEVVAPMKKHQN